MPQQQRTVLLTITGLVQGVSAGDVCGYFGIGIVTHHHLGSGYIGQGAAGGVLEQGNSAVDGVGSPSQVA